MRFQKVSKNQRTNVEFIVLKSRLSIICLSYRYREDIADVTTDINVPITGSLALNQKVSLFQCLAYLNNKKFVCKQIPSLFYS